MESNAWERAQEAIARAGARSDEVITPDTAVSPFDASMTTVIPHADVVRRGPPDPDSTQRLPHNTPRPPQDRAPAPRRPDDPGRGGNGRPYGGPPPRPPELSDPSLPRVTHGPSRPGTSPFPAVNSHDGYGYDGPGYDGHDADVGTPPHGFPPIGEPEADDEPRARPSFWKRLFGRG